MTIDSTTALAKRRFDRLARYYDALDLLGAAVEGPLVRFIAAEL